MRRLLTLLFLLAFAAVLAALLLVPPAQALGRPAPHRPAPAIAVDTPLPTCRYADEPVARDSYDDWDATLVDTIFRLPDSYVPPDLVALSRAGVAASKSGMTLRALVIDDLRALDQAARAAGYRIVIRSAYRSAAYQRRLYTAAVKADGRTVARRYTARPGHSEHQLGTTVDIGTKGGPAPFTLADWSKTKTGAYVNANAWRYGFIRSYPKAEAGEGPVNPRTCYASEPWHFRYVGRERAAAVHASALTLRAWLYAHRAE